MTPVNTVPSQFLSEVFKLFDGADVSKKTKFILTGITSGNTRELSIPDANGVIVLEGSSPVLATLYYTGDLIEVKVASAAITVQRNQTGSYSSETWLPVGNHNVRIITDYHLSQAPTLDTNKGSLSIFSGSAKVWTAVLSITSGGDGTLTFSNAILVNGAGTGTTISSGATHHQDTSAPTIVNANFGTVDWRGNDGLVTITVACGESTIGWTGQVNLSTWGGSALQALSSSGNNMAASFTPTIADADDTATGIYVYDRAGNAGTNNNYTSDNQLQTHDYRVEAEDLNFLAYSVVSEVLSGSQSFTTTDDVLVTWGVMDGQFWPTGNLVYGAEEDFIIDDNNKIHLNETKYADEIASNSLGLMFVNVREF